MKRREFNRLSLSSTAGLLMLPRQWAYAAGKSTLTDSEAIPKTDTHMHLFGLDHLSYPWLKNAPEIHRDFLPEDFIQATESSHVTKIVFMESGAATGSSLKEVDWVIGQAPKDPRIKGIVAKGVLNRGGRLEPGIDQLMAKPWVKGIRGATDPNMLASSDFVSIMKLLAQNNLSFDLLISPKLFGDVARAVRKVPDTVFVLDHLGNPDIEGGQYDVWAKGLEELAQCPNVNCKISGIITRAGKNWKAEMLRPYVHFVIEKFGFDRIVYGGDWPVVLRAGSYVSWSQAFEQLTDQFSTEEKHKLYHRNADRIYRLG